MRRVWFSIQVIVICFIWLQLILYLIVDEHAPLCHVKVCLEFTSLCSAAVLQLVGKTWPPDSGPSTWNITCNVWIGCSAQMIGSPEPYIIRFISKFHRTILYHLFEYIFHWVNISVKLKHYTLLKSNTSFNIQLNPVLDKILHRTEKWWSDSRLFLKLPDQMLLTNCSLNNNEQ